MIITITVIANNNHTVTKSIPAYSTALLWYTFHQNHAVPANHMQILSP